MPRYGEGATGEGAIGEGPRPLSIKEDLFSISVPCAFGLLVTLIVRALFVMELAWDCLRNVEVGMMEGLRRRPLRGRDGERKKWALALLNCH